MNKQRRTTYPMTLYTNIYEHLSDDLKEYYEHHKDEKQFHESLYDICAEVLNDALNGRSEQEELRAIWNNIRKQDNRKKKRWVEKLKIDVEQLDVRSKNHPFQGLLALKATLDRESWEKLYGRHSLADIIKNEVKKAEQWAENPDSWFIDYPVLSSLPLSRRIQAFERDVLRDEFSILDAMYQLNLNDYFRTYIDEMEIGPMFIDAKKRVEIADNEPVVIPMDEDGTSKMVLEVVNTAFGDLSAFSRLDIKDRDLLFLIIKKASSGPSESGEVVISVGELARCLTQKNNASQFFYHEAEQRIMNIVNTAYNHYNAKGERDFAINYLDSAAIQTTGKSRYMTIRLGRTIHDAIVNDRIRRFSSVEYQKLENRAGQLMYLRMQKERIRAHMKYKAGAKDCLVDLDYSDFLSMLAFKSNNKKKNWKEIKEALDEYKRRGVMIEDLVYDNISYIAHVTFYPLTQDEERDLAWYGFEDEKKLVEHAE